MSQHDQKLIDAARGMRKPNGLLSNLRLGARQLNLRPAPPKIKLGTNADDWRAVGNDLRTAMRQMDTCD